MFLENFLPTWLLESIYVLTPDRLKDLQSKELSLTWTIQS